MLEQPLSHPVGFKYDCEARSSKDMGHIKGSRSTLRNRTLPAVKVGRKENNVEC